MRKKNTKAVILIEHKDSDLVGQFSKRNQIVSKNGDNKTKMTFPRAKTYLCKKFRA